MYSEGGDFIEYTCPFCGNKNSKFFGYKNGIIYCRKCISFRGEMASAPSKSFIDSKNYKIDISYTLSDEQKNIAKNVLEGYKKHINTLIYAVCGAGKTELVFSVIEYALQNNYKIGFAIPRKDVVIELRKRLEVTFKHKKVIALYGGNTDDLYGDIIVLTTHQLYRYEKYFDLLILDELDAFPYKDNEVLEALFKRSIKGNYVLMSATPSKRIIDEFSKPNHQILKLFHRYHKHPLPVPTMHISYLFFKQLFVIEKLKKYQKENKPVLVFAPTIGECEFLYKIVSFFVKKGDFVHSKRKERNEIIENFRNKKTNYLVTTSVLERGVTLPNLQVIIFHADHELYNESALIQISGRVGRVKDFPKGDVIYVARKKKEPMLNSINTIKEYNTSM